VATKPTFRTAFKKRRCLALADGYYEWRNEGKIKQPSIWRHGPCNADRDDQQNHVFAGIPRFRPWINATDWHHT
jgi:putative SOS response-associated peptidase YedK